MSLEALETYLRLVMRFLGGSGFGTPARPRRGPRQTRRLSGKTHAWVCAGSGETHAGVRRDPRLGLARPMPGLAASVAVGPTVFVAVGTAFLTSGR
jgi:hypothetical protein